MFTEWTIDSDKTLYLRGMERSDRETCVSNLFYMRIADGGVINGGDKLCLQAVSKKYLEFVFRLALGIVLVFFLLLLHHLHPVALPITMHLGFVPVLTQVFGNIAAVKLKVQYNKQLIESLNKQSQKH